MATNMALKRARKAQRRKQVVAEKRKIEALETSLAGRVRRAAQMPIQHCLLAESLFEIGLGMLVLARGPTPHSVTLSAFLIDVFCLGIKDVMVRSVGAEELAMYIETMEARASMVPVEPSYARKLLGDVAAWAQSLGFPPHRDFAVAERMFGDVSAAGCNVDFRFGRDGKPLYMPGPTESASLVQRRLEHLRTTLGDDDFDFDAPL
jgi:hypothetical protein